MALSSSGSGLMGAGNLKLAIEIADKKKNENKAISILKKNIGYSYLCQTEGKSSGVDNTGAVGANKTSFQSVDAQREIFWMIRNAFVKGDTAYITRASTAFVYAFDRQNVAGYFENGVGATALQAIESNTFFMSAFFTSYYVIANESALASVKASYDSYAPKISASLAWLEANKTTVYSVGSNTPNRLLFAAMAYYFGARYLNSTTYKTTGESFISYAVAMLHQDGYFLEKGGWDSSYQGVSVLNLCFLYLHSVDNTFRATIKTYIDTTASWLLTRILPTGEVSAVGNTRTGLGQEQHSGKVKEINYGEVSLALFYAGFILGRNDMIQYAYYIQYYVYTHS